MRIQQAKRRLNLHRSRHRKLQLCRIRLGWGKKLPEEGFFYRRLIRPILDLLRQGVTPEKIALSIALGGALGVFPALGSTTALCARLRSFYA